MKKFTDKFWDAVAKNIYKLNYPFEFLARLLNVDSSWFRHAILSFATVVGIYWLGKLMFGGDPYHTLINAKCLSFVVWYGYEFITGYLRMQKGIENNVTDIFRDSIANLVGIFFLGEIFEWLILSTPY